MNESCGNCGKPVAYQMKRIPEDLISVLGSDRRLEPVSNYWLAVDGHRVKPIIEPYCNASCSLARHQQ
jgi:hypothetical protein